VAEQSQPPVVMWVRFRPGIVGLTRRMVHVVPVPAGDVVPQRLTAYCGQPFEPGQAELLTEAAGAPCTMCLLLWPLPPPGTPAVTASPDGSRSAR
jgi:hypothetical protein